MTKKQMKELLTKTKELTQVTKELREALKENIKERKALSDWLDKEIKRTNKLKRRK